MQQPEHEFSDYEFWIFVETVFHSNQYAQSLNLKQQQALLESIRKKHCPSITNKQWLEIELNIVNNRNILIDSMLESASASAGMTNNILKFDEMAHFDSLFLQELSSFDFDGIKKQLQKNGVADSRLADLLDLLKTKKNVMFNDK